uniref:Glycosyltransferase 2-like domain-containing protein n=1 Tax=viral metagenome TaxID=1070528 RepID=A0A6C0H566_9ZZZZ
MNKTLYLCMIVKNESKIIKRMLDSVINYIDGYCICDTGSTDNTKEIIEEYFREKKMNGKLFEEPFKNFGYNRNMALKEAYGMSDYLLLMDADMVMITNLTRSMFHELLNMGNFFQIIQGTDEFYYANIRIIKNVMECRYSGVTHEYINYPGGEYYLVNRNDIFILDIGDGGSKGDKFERDVKLLEEGIINEPENEARYTFYLASTYYELDKIELAIEYFKKRIGMGNYEQEIWYSYYKIGKGYIKLNECEKGIYWLLEGYNHNPNRFENMYEIIHYYRSFSNKQKLAFYFLKEIMEKTNNGDFTSIKGVNIDNYLFLHKSVYSYLLYFEYITLAYYNGIKRVGKETIYILNASNDENINRATLFNYSFYDNILEQKRVYNLSNTLEYENKKYYSSSSCIFKTKNNNYGLNIRYVNYRINKTNGRYEDCEDNIITLNRYVEFDSLENMMEFKRDKLFKNIKKNGNKYIGIEDIRVYNDKYIGTGELKTGNLGMIIGKYDLKKDKLKEYEIEISDSINKENKPKCEKNWVFYDNNKLIYKWYPLIIGKIDEKKEKLELIDVKMMPKIFRYIRGSTCGFKYESEIWFITHIVCNCNPRIYYHCIVIFDENMNLLGLSSPFKFGNEKIEYCLGFIIENNEMIISYSEWDETTKIGVYDLSEIKKIMYNL